jgi:hypothetical protein
VETYSGSIWVESKLGEGTTFRFTINGRHVPAAPDAPVAPRSGAAGAVAEPDEPPPPPPPLPIRPRPSDAAQEQVRPVAGESGDASRAA